MTPAGGTTTATTWQAFVSVCTSPAHPASDTTYFNGAVLGGWSIVNNCNNLTTPVETLVPGTNIFRARGCSAQTATMDSTCAGALVTVIHPATTISPRGQALSVSARTTASQKFAITNDMAVQETFTLGLTCTGTGVVNCSAPTSVTIPAGAIDSVTVSYSVTDTLNATGIVQLKVSLGTSYSDSGWYNYTVNGSMTVSTVYTNQEDQDYSRCASSCFTGIVSMSTIPYVSRGASRQVTLAYNGDRVALRPTVYADVTMAQPLTDTVQTFQLRAYVLGSMAMFTNGERVLTFSGSPSNHSGKPFRLAGVINVDSTLANPSTGVYQMQLVVTANYADHTEQFIDTTHTLSIVNTRTSHVARGWTIAGIPTLYSYIHNGGNIDQLKMMVPTGDGSSVTYTTTNGCLPVCVPVLPAGVFSTMAEQFSFQGTYQGWERLYPDSSKEFYAFTAPTADYTLTSLISRTQADTIGYTYDSQILTDTGVAPRVLTISDPQRMYKGAHAVITLQYNSTTGYLSKIIEPGVDGGPDSGRVTTVTVNSSGFLTTWKDPDGDTTHFGYDSQGRLDSLVDRNGNLTTYTYEPIASKLVAVTSPPVALDFNSTGTLNTINLVTTYRPWQIVGVPTSPTASSPWTPVEADTIEGMVTTTAGDTSRFTMDQWGQPLVSIGNDTIRTTYVRNANGFATAITYPIGGEDLATYNGPFLVVSQRAGQDATNYTYGAFGQLTSIYGTHQPTQTFYLGSRGHVDSTTVNGSTTRFHPDALLRDTSVVDAVGDTTRYHYHAVTGNMDTVSSLPSTFYRYTAKQFDRYGRDSVVRTSGTGSPTVVTTTLYDLLNRPDSVFDGVHARPTIYHRDGLNVTRVTDPDSQVYTTTYNSMNLPVTQTDPTNRTITTTYTSHLVRATVTNRRGQMTKYLYDPLVRLTHVHRPASMTGELDTLEVITTSRLGDTVNAWNPVTREISYLSRTTGYLDSSLTIFLLEGNREFKRTFFHDSRGRVDSVAITTSTNVTGIDPYARAYHYDSTTALLKAVVTGSASVNFGYDAVFRSDTIAYSGSSAVRYDTYSAFGTLLNTNWTGINLYRGYGYDSTGRIIEMDHGIPAPDTVEFYTYDPLGHLVQRQVGKWTDTITTCPGGTFYGNGCKAGEQRTYATLEQDNYSWDAAGNLDTVKVGSADTAATFLLGNRLASWTGFTFAGDSDGNRTTSSAGPQYTWSSDGRLVSVVSGSTTRIYDYDNYGQLARRTTNGKVDRYYLWDGGQLLAILDSAANTRVAEFSYNPGSTDLPLLRITGAKGSSSVHFYARDGLGNTVGQFSGSTLEQQLMYDPWGASRVNSTTGDTTQLRWKGLLYEDGVTSLYYMRARWYDPVTRRFLSPDPLGLSAGMNQYAFAAGDPINGSDPSGQLCEDPDDGGDCAMEGGGGGGGGGGGADPWGSGPASQQAYFASVGQGVCSIYLPCNNGDITGANPLMPGYQDPYHQYGCGNFTDTQCNMLYSAISFYMASPDPSPCHAMGAEIAASLYQGSLVAGFPPSSTADAYTSNVVRGVGGAFTELGNNAFYYGQPWLTYTAGHEMNHLYQGLIDNNPNTNTIANPAAAPAIACVYGANATEATPGPYTGP